ncbi:bacteriocin [Streptococcus equi subsp. zooepidemicus]|nr:bacteriocin [Streptococcus equi]MDI6043442.1 bacteriocin [Streptococcus equi subsp. zooepidemicus]HEL0023308.1 bacteriocin [Streptococcus equi subsp. zooepidemicus]HEL1221454.1 bacteriocin [Streptococcus equi subsp. zooepidemicus]
MDTKFTALTEEQLKSVEGGKNGVVKLPGGTGVYC